MTKKTVAIIKSVWILTGMTLVALCVLEGVASLGFLVKDRLTESESEALDHRAAADAYSDRSWVHSYYREFHHSRNLQWKSYVYWRQKPHRGNYINIDEHGIRLTTDGDPAKDESTRVLKIFMFGGSTLWGTGARDAFTIPSLVAKELHDKGIAAEITNFGETAYVSTQELIALLLRLRQRDFPDLVIFYDGVNDIMSAYQQNAAGLPQNEFNRVREFNLSGPERLNYRALLVARGVIEQLSMVRLLRDLLGRSAAQRDNEKAANGLETEKQSATRQVVEFQSLAMDVLRSYVANLELIAALSDDYGFRYLFYWQPSILDKAHLSKFERLQREKMRSAEPFIRKTHEILRQARLRDKYGNSFHDLTGLFSEVRDPIYLDWSHPGESGNKMIAKRMADDILHTLTAGNAY